MSLSAYMSMDFPVVSSTVGTTWATMLNACLTLVDAHDHSSGKGAKITPDGFNMTGNLDFLYYSAINLGTCRFHDVGATYTSSPNLNCCYVNGGELYFTDASGNAVQITSSGSVNVGGAGSITGMGGTSAALTYSNTTKVFTFTQDSNHAAKINCGDISIREATAGVTNTITVKSPTGLVSSYTVELPAATPASDSLLLMNSSGVVSCTRALSIDSISSTTATLGSATITAGLTAATLKMTTGAAANRILKSDASGNATWGQLVTAEITNANVTRAKLEAVGQQVSASCGFWSTASTSFVDVTNLTVTITTTGRPVCIMCQSDGGTLYLSSFFDGRNLIALLLRDSTKVAEVRVGYSSTYGTYISPAAVHHIDVVGAGTYTYKLQVRTTSGVASDVAYMKLVAFEL